MDRTAVLVLGLVAGFLVGASFTRSAVPMPSNGPIIPAVALPTSPGRPALPTAPRQTAIDPRVVRRVAQTGVVRVGVFGDSFGVGLWDALYRLLPADQGFQILKFSKEATGFTRYRIDNLEHRARAQLAADPVDIAVVSIGVNDATDMWEGKLYRFMDEGWQRVVGDRVDRFVEATESTGARVFWIGLPAMRDPALDAKVRVLNTFFAARMARLGVTFIDTRPQSVDRQGSYAPYLPDPRSGRPMLVRTGDGIHMIGVGYQRILRDAVVQIRLQAARARAAAHRATPVGHIAAGGAR